MIVKDAFNDIDRKPLPRRDGLAGLDYLDRVAGMQIGQGSRVFRGDQSGIWLGAARFADAPFSVDMDGNATMNSLAVGDYLTKPGTNQQVSGQIIVGGSVNGKVIVKNSSDVDKVTLDQDGITVNDGKIVVKDSGSTTILDATGLVSSANFANASVTGSDFNTSSGSYTDITNASSTFSVVNANARVLVIISAKIGNSDAANGNYASMCLNVDGNNEQGPVIVGAGTPHSGGVIFNTSAVSTILTLSAGSHTLKLRLKSSGNTAYTNSPTLTYVVLGK